MKNIFTPTLAEDVINRIQKLTPASKASWGKMTVDQMLAHCNVAYDMTFTDKYPAPNFFMKLMLKTFIKKPVVNETPYAKNGKTGPQFIITDKRNFEAERDKLISYIQQCQKLGPDHFEQKESHSFGKLSSTEWSNMFYKHLDHHLTQFGV